MPTKFGMAIYMHTYKYNQHHNTDYKEYCWKDEIVLLSYSIGDSYFTAAVTHVCRNLQ